MASNFDPDAFLAGTQPTSQAFDPDAFLAGTPSKSIAEKIEPGVYGDTDPVEQRLIENLGTAVGGAGTADLGLKVGSGIINKVGSFFSAAPDLLNAGVKEGTVSKMVPRGVNPATYVEGLQEQLNKEGALGKDAKSTWNNIYHPTKGLLPDATQDLGNALNNISDAAQSSGIAHPLETDISSLQPLVDEWAERAGGDLPSTRRTAAPFENIHRGLVEDASKNGGMLSLGDIESAMQEVGPLTHSGPQALQEAHSGVYATLANIRDNIIKQIADSSGDENLGTDLLDANDRVSRYLRIMPDIQKAAAGEPIKAGVSTFKKIGGPALVRYGLGSLGADVLARNLFNQKSGGQ